MTHTAENTSESRVVGFNDIHGTGRGSDRHTKAEEETSAHELSGGVGAGLDGSSNNDGGSTNEHAPATAKAINARTNEGESDNTTDLIHGSDDTSPDTVVLDTIPFLEGGVLEQIVDKRAVISVHGTAEESNEREGIEPELSPSPSIGRLLEHGLGELLAALDHLMLNVLLYERQHVLVKLALQYGDGPASIGEHGTNKPRGPHHRGPPA
jgi:hypothetical protein